MTTDTSKWPEETRRLREAIELMDADNLTMQIRRRQAKRDLESLVARLCPDPEAHAPEAAYSGRDENAAHEALGKVHRFRPNGAGTWPEIGVVEVNRARNALLHAYGQINALRAQWREWTARGEPARQPCDEGAPGSTPSRDQSTQALAHPNPHPQCGYCNGTGLQPELNDQGKETGNAIRCTCGDLYTAKPQEPDEPEWVRVAPSITEALSALQSLYYAQMVREALRERAELLRALDTITERASRLDRERDEARAEVERLRTGIDVWRRLYAPEECDAEGNAKARKAVTKAGGVLAYIADLLASNADPNPTEERTAGMCTVCGVEPVATEEGFDTCSSCLASQ